MLSSVILSSYNVFATSIILIHHDMKQYSLDSLSGTINTVYVLFCSLHDFPMSFNTTRHIWKAELLQEITETTVLKTILTDTE